MPQQKSSNRRALSPQQQRDLDIEIEFIEGVVRRAPDYTEALQVLGDGYTRRGRYQDGLRVDEQLVQLRPTDALAHYNLACSYGLSEQFERAVETLHRALDLGFRDFKWLRRDPDLRQVRKHRLYRQIRERILALDVQVRG
jgi:tetratricopeptide (TPR) repeat protein